MAKAPTSREMRYHRLDDFIALHRSKLPQIVKVGQGFHGTSLDQSVETGEVLIIFRVEREKKILARQVSSGRGLCFSRTCRDLKVEMMVPDTSHENFNTLDPMVELPSRYIRVLENITSFGLLAGDVLQLSWERPYSNGCNVRCLLVSLKDPVYVDLPASVEGKFQVLSKYGIFSIDEVLRESSLPVEVRVVALERTTLDKICNDATPLAIDQIGKVHLEREIEGDTVFAISLHKENSILMFPSTLDISVAQCISHLDILSSSGAEYKQVVNAIESDKVLLSMLSEDCVYFTSDPVKRYGLEMFQFISFPFTRKQRVVTTGRGDARAQRQDNFCPRLQSTAQKQPATFESDGILGTQPGSFSENEVPPLPPKMTLIATQCHVSTEEDQVHDTESKRESEKKCASFEIHSKQEAPTRCLQNDFHDQGLFWSPDQQGENTLLQPDVTSSFKMHIFGENFSESEEAASNSKGKAYEPQLDVNANLSLAAGVNMDSRPKQGSFLQPMQTPCHLSRSFPGIRSEAADEVHEPHLPRKPLLSMENDLSQGFTTETSEKAAREQHKCDRSSPEQSDETDEDNTSSNNLDLSYREELSDDYPSNAECGCQQGGVQSVGSVRQRELKSPEGDSEGEFSRANVDIPKKNFFYSLTPRWFRQDASKSAKKDKGQVLKGKSKSLKIPGRHAASDENILISSPREDDFERMSSITKYLQTQDKLTRALVHISRLESQGQRDVETAPTCDSNREFANGQQQSSTESGKDWPKNEREVDTQDSQIPDKTLPFTLAHTPEDQEAAGLPVPHHVGFRKSSKAWQHQEPSERGHHDRRREEISDGQRLSNNGPTGAASNANDTESVKPLGYSCQNDSRFLFRQYHDSDREPRHEEFIKVCPNCRSYFTDAFDEELSENEAKHKLKKAILGINWSDDEWMELTEVVRKRTEAGRVHVPYVNMPSSHERPTASSMDHTSAVGPSCPNSNGDMSRRVGMPPYENLKQDTSRTTTLPYQNISGDTCQASMYNDVQRLGIRAQGKPPIPTPRSKLSSI